MEKTIAVVVSYNRQKLLSECITALRNQSSKLDTILVINNGSTDNTEEWLKQQPDLKFITQDNLGSSGGFNTGISWAHANGYSWIWCMDDDGYPKEDALENLLNTNISELSLLNCAVINKEDKKSFVWKTKNYQKIDDVKTSLIKGIGHPFNGTLIHRKIVDRVGLPKKTLFLWGDETEYYYRITKKNKIPVYTVADSIHYHPAAAFSLNKDWNFNESWKMYFYVRNRFHILKTKCYASPVALFNYLFFLLAFVGVIMIFQKTDRVKKLKFLAWPVADAFKNNYVQTPQTILLRLNANSIPGQSVLFKNKLINYFQSLLPALALSKQRATVNV